MSFNASTVPAFRAALKAGIQATVGSSVFVTDGPAPGGIADHEEQIELLDVDGEQIIHALNRTTQPRAERMTLTMLITVVQATREDQTTPNERAFVLLDAINQLLRGDPYLAAYYTGPGKVYGAHITSLKHTTRMDKSQEHREAGLEVGVYWEGRI